MRSRNYQEEFIEKSKRKHGDRYDYSKSVYSGTYNKLIIICKEHGEFQQRPDSHSDGRGCNKCAIESKHMDRDEFIRLSREIHGNIYKYELPNKIPDITKVKISCDIHGIFHTTIASHIRCKRGCPVCSKENKTVHTSKENLEIFLKKSKLVHGDTYDYSKSVYIRMNDEIKIICKFHGEFSQLAYIHSIGGGCSECANSSNAKRCLLSHQDFIERALDIHGNEYDYSESVYIGSKKLVDIICKKHGKFSQNAGRHMNGSGCLQCAKESDCFSKRGFVKIAHGKPCIFYILKCFNSDETFYKIGITSKSVKSRYTSKINMPYSYEIIKEYEGTAENVYDMEQSHKILLSSYKYTPNINFHGSKRECFTKYKE